MKIKKEILSKPFFKKVTDILTIILLLVFLVTYDFDAKLLLLEMGIFSLIWLFLIIIGLVVNKLLKKYQP